MVLYLIVLVLITVIAYTILPNVCTRLLHWFVIVRGPEEKRVALTFDDGPDEEFTPLLLDELNRQGIVATFFVLAEQALEYPNIIRRMQSEGHDVQIHGWSHRLVPLLLPKSTMKQFRETRKLLQEHFNATAEFYRPTWGLLNLATLLTYRSPVKLVTWSIMVGDWRVTDKEELHRRIMKKLHPGAVIVLHDSDKTPGAQTGAPRQVIALIPALVDSLRQQGYDFCLLGDWFKTHHA